MTRALLDRFLAGTLPDPDGRGNLVSPLRDIVIDRNLGPRASQLIAGLGLSSRLAVVMDPETQRVLGEQVTRSLETGAEVTRVVLEHRPHPDLEAVQSVIAASADADALVAVGSGSINDIVKYAAHVAGRPYVVFGTAPSMNGYTSVSAAITEDGLKKSLPATLARGIFLDLDVMATAPQRLIAAGFGDSMARSTAQVDWLLSHLLLGTPYREAPFMLLREDEDALVASAEALGRGEVAAVELLVRTLVLSGLGMTLCGGSYPASQGEHLIAHYLDMRGENLPFAYHGEHIAVTTLTMARMQETLLARPVLRLRCLNETEADYIDVFGAELGASCWQACAAKILDEEAVEAINLRLADQWPEIRERVRAAARPVAEIERAMVAVGAPTSPDDVGIPADFYEDAVTQARRIRDRFTTLDLAAMAAMAVDG
jgi:glycerol-1-phosphate dehydrogenase [NAD(P)+]